MRKATLLPVLAGLLLVGLWAVLRSGPTEPNSALSPVGASAPEPATDLVELTGDAARTSQPDRTALEVEPGLEAVAAGEEPAAAPAPDAPPANERLVTLDLTYVRPDRRGLQLLDVELTFTDANGRPWTFHRAGRADGIQVQLPEGTFEVTGRARGHRFVPDSRVVEGGRIHRDPRLTFWPEAWIPVTVRTPDGRPFEALATDLGLHPKRFFDRALTVRVSRSPFGDDGEAVPESTLLATPRPPAGYQSTSISRAVACSLELHVDPPLWVALFVHGGFYEARVLRAGDREIPFTLDLDALDARFATVRARMVDSETKAPAVDALGTLKADRSAHRRRDLSEQSPDADGVLLFERVMPGKQELTVTRGANIVQRWVTPNAGEEIDLGDLPIGAGPGIPLRAIGADGRPAQAIVEIAPYERGAREKQLYHPNLWRTTDDRGEYELPMPDTVSIVRCREHRGGTHTPVATLNVLVDPAHPPAELVMKLQDAHEVGFIPRVPWEHRYQMTVEDELGVIRATHLSRGEQIELVPGPYVVRLWDGDLELRSELVEVPARDAQLDAP